MALQAPAEGEWLSSSNEGHSLETTQASTNAMDCAAPRHPVPTMQGAFEESMVETIAELEAAVPENRYYNADKETRRKLLLENAQYERTVAGRWVQRPGEKFHPLWKLVSQISFGMHLLHEGLAKSDDEVIKILQTHVDEIDGFLERTTEDFDLAQDDIDERIRYLKLPLEHGEVFDTMLGDRAFRIAIVDGNEKIEHIVDRTTAAMKDALKDVQKGLDSTKELARYLRDLDRRWNDKSEEHAAVYAAMLGNTEGWSGAYLELQAKGIQLGKSLVRLGAIISEIQRRAGVASRRNLSALQPSAAAGGQRAADSHSTTQQPRSVSDSSRQTRRHSPAPDLSPASHHHQSQQAIELVCPTSSVPASSEFRLGRISTRQPIKDNPGNMLDSQGIDVPSAHPDVTETFSPRAVYLTRNLDNAGLQSGLRSAPSSEDVGSDLDQDGERVDHVHLRLRNTPARGVSLPRLETKPAVYDLPLRHFHSRDSTAASTSKNVSTHRPSLSARASESILGSFRQPRTRKYPILPSAESFSVSTPPSAPITWQQTTANSSADEEINLIPARLEVGSANSARLIRPLASSIKVPGSASLFDNHPLTPHSPSFADLTSAAIIGPEIENTFPTSTASSVDVRHPETLQRLATVDNVDLAASVPHEPRRKTRKLSPFPPASSTPPQAISPNRARVRSSGLLSPPTTPLSPWKKMFGGLGAKKGSSSGRSDKPESLVTTIMSSDKEEVQRKASADAGQPVR